MLNKAFESRKFLAMLCALAAIGVLTGFGKLDETSANAVIYVFGIYATGNVGEHWMESKKLVARNGAP